MAVYFAQASSGHMKIGHSANPERRLPYLPNPYGAPISLVRVIPGARAEEKWLHAYFSRLRRWQEWFDFHPDMMTVTPMGAMPPEDARPFVIADRQIVFDLPPEITLHL